MIRRAALAAVASALACATLRAAPAAAPAPASPGFTVEPVAPGVALWRGDARLGGVNSLVVERKDGLLVVDAQPSPEAARRLLAALAKAHKKSVRYLVLSHPHVEAWGGASAFPGTVLIVASAGCRRALDNPAYDASQELRARVPARADVEPSRPAPVLVLDAPARLDDPDNPVDLLPLPLAHSSGDLIVLLSKPRVIHAGDLVWPGRDAYAGDASVNNWITQLNNITAESPAAVTGLRGPAFDSLAVRRQRDTFAWIKGTVSQLFVDLVKIQDMASRIASHPKLGDFFDTAGSPAFLSRITDVVVAEALVDRRKRGVPDP